MGYRPYPPLERTGVTMSAVQITRPTVKLSEVFPPEAIVMRLEDRSKSGVIESLVRHAVRLGQVPRTAEGGLVRSLQERETLGTTALGKGIAFPHCRSCFIEQIIGVAGFLKSRIPFDAIDAEPVGSVFLILAPLDERERFLEIMGRLVAIGRDRSLGVLLRGCRNAEQVSSFLQELDQPRLDDPHEAGIYQRPLRRSAPPPGPPQGHLQPPGGLP
jgi:nitrogen PTS system EIIA component